MGLETGRVARRGDRGGGQRPHTHVSQSLLAGTLAMHGGRPAGSVPRLMQRQHFGLGRLSCGQHTMR